MEGVLIDGDDVEHCKIRKRGISSSASSSSSSALVRKHRSTKKKVGMMEDDHVVSARKLGASLWEINDVLVSPSKSNKSHSRSASSHMSDPSPAVSQIDNHHNNRPPREARQRLQQLTEYDNNNNNMAEIEESKPRLQDVSNGLVTSRELVKVLHRVWQHQDHHSNSTGSNILSALKLELHRLRSQVDQLMHQQRCNRDEMNHHLLHQFAQEKAAWRSKERERIRDAISVIASELEVEKKLRKQTERLNKKLGKELSDTKELLEAEKRAKEVLGQVCDELVKGIAEDRAKVEEMKRESARVIEEVEKEREMLQVAHVLREERLQMTLSEAKYHFQEKNAAVDKLRTKLEGYLTNKIDHHYDDDNDDDDYGDDEDEDECRKIEELRMVLRKSGIEESKVGDSDSGGESDLHSIELDHVDKEDEDIEIDSRRSSVEMFKGRKSLSEKVQWGSICLNKQPIIPIPIPIPSSGNKC